jgi:hypothetical protein
LLNLDECLNHAMSVRGALGASVVDYGTGLLIGCAGRSPVEDPDSTGLGAHQAVRSIVDQIAFAPLGRPGRCDDVVITASNGYHVIQVVSDRHEARLLLYVWLDPVAGNLAMARRTLRQLADDLTAA